MARRIVSPKKAEEKKPEEGVATKAASGEGENGEQSHDHGSRPSGEREEVSLTDLEQAVVTPAPPGPDAPPPPPTNPAPPPLPTQQPVVAPVVATAATKPCWSCGTVIASTAGFCHECGLGQSDEAKAAELAKRAQASTQVVTPAAPVAAAIPPTVWSAPAPSPLAAQQPAAPVVVPELAWYLADAGGNPLGPFNKATMATKGLQATTLVHRAGGPGWTTAGKEPELKALIPAPPAATVPPVTAPQPATVNTPGFNPFAPPAAPVAPAAPSNPAPAAPTLPTPRFKKCGECGADTPRFGRKCGECGADLPTQ